MEKTNRKKPLVFLDVCIDGAPAERMVFELFTDISPKTAENFRALCTGEKGLSIKTGKPLHYKGTFFHLIVKGHVAQAGDFLRQDGKFGESIYGGKFPDESPKLKHDGPGLLTMAIDDREERGSLFYVTFKADHRLDRKYVVFGKLVDGLEVLKKIETAGDENGNPTVTVKIINSGELHDDKKKGNKLKMDKDTIERNNNAEKRKGKHKKASNKWRKRRRYYTSESDSSSDTDMESSESDSDFESYDTSLSGSSSSSNVRRRKRKRSKRDKKKHGKRKDRGREKRRKKRDRKKKRKSKRDSTSDSESVSKSESRSDENAVVEALDGKRKSAGNQSPVQEREISTVNRKKGDEANMSEGEECEFPKENGNHQGNGIDPEMESDQSPDRHPDPVDNHPSKSRSRNLSPRRTTSKSMSISPIKNAHRSPSFSGSPQQIFKKSKSKSPVRSESSSSPIRSPPRITKGINRSMSPPVRSPFQQSRSRSPTASPPRRRVAHSPPRTSSRRASHRSLSRSPKRPLRRSVSRSSGRAAPPRRSPSQSPVRAPNRITRRSYSRSPVSAGRRARSPVSDRGRSSSRSRSVDHGSPKRIRRGRGFSDRYSYVRRYRSRSPDRSPIRPYRYGGRSDRDRYSSYRRSPRRYRSPPRGRTPPRYRNRRGRTRSPSVSHSPIRHRKRRYSPSRSPVRSNSPVDRYNKGPVRGERPKSHSRSRSRSRSPSSRDSRSPRRGDDKVNSRSSSKSPPQKAGLVSYVDGSLDSGRD